MTIVHRDIVAIINQIREKLPAEEIEFKERLDWIENDAVYRPPEDKWISWNYLTHSVMEHVPKATTLWECEVLSILSTKPLEDIKKHFYIID